MAFKWNDDLIKELTQLWVEENWTASEIGQHFGGLTRNVIMGKLNRLGLLGKKDPNKAPKSRSKARQRPAQPIPVSEEAPVILIEAIEETPPVDPIPQPEPEETTTDMDVVASEPEKAPGKRITDLYANQCRYPLGELMAKPEFFCGEPTLVGKCYCWEHYQRVYVPNIYHKKRAA